MESGGHHVWHGVGERATGCDGLGGGDVRLQSGSGCRAGAGSQTLSVTFNPADTVDYTMAMAIATLSVRQATPTITWSNPAAITYGTALTSTQLNASASVSGSYQYNPAVGAVLSVGNSQPLNVVFTPIDTIDYTTAPATVYINIMPLQTTPTITWSNPSAITFGTVLSSTQLDATASVAGTMTYTPALGTMLNVGNNKALKVTFTPTDTTHYTTAQATVYINVIPATATITWANPADITFGTALSGTELNATTSVAGTMVYSPAAGTILNAGNNQALNVTFTPTDTTNYVGNTTTVHINVMKVTPMVTWANPADITFGSA